MNKNSKKAWQLVMLLAIDFALLILITSVCVTNAECFCLGCYGENIGEIQQILKDKKLYYGDIDGEYNFETRRCIKSFQNNFFGNGNGETDFETLRALGIKSSTADCFNMQAQLLARCITVSECRNYPQMIEKGIEILSNPQTLGRYASLRFFNDFSFDSEPSSQAYSAANAAIIIFNNKLLN